MAKRNDDSLGKSESIQLNKLRNLLKHASENSLFYKEKFKAVDKNKLTIGKISDLSHFPILSRNDIRENYNTILAKNIASNEIVKVSTSGSSEKPIFLARHKKTLPVLTQWKILKLWDINPWDNKAFIYRYPFNNLYHLKDSITWWPTKKIYLDGGNMSKTSIAKYVRQYNKYRPKLLQGYVDLVHEFAIHLKMNAIEIIPPKAVWVTSGPLLKNQRKLMEEVFKAPVYDQYGCTEILYVSAECTVKNGMHIFSDNVYVEIVDENYNQVAENVNGKILLTDLENYAFPLIRYDIGDYGKLLDFKCTCGLPAPLMDNVTGRFKDILKTPSGLWVGTDYLITLFDNNSETILAFQFEQASDYTIFINYISFEKESAIKDVNIAIEKLHHKLNNEVIIKGRKVESLMKINGKTRFLLSEVK